MKVGSMIDHRKVSDLTVEEFIGIIQTHTQVVTADMVRRALNRTEDKPLPGPHKMVRGQWIDGVFFECGEVDPKLPEEKQLTPQCMGRAASYGNPDSCTCAWFVESVAFPDGRKPIKPPKGKAKP